MKIFPKSAKFCFSWRSYQKQVLEELDSHLHDNHLNIVAAPGSGKTILGLEVMLRINRPTLILTPSIAIRNQWITRFLEHFLQTLEKPEWISDDIKNIQFLNVATYQALHSVFNKKENKENFIKKLNQKNIHTIIIDEAHHLRSEWWKSLIYLKNNIKEPHIVSLTATPPYDVSHQEWKNYQNLCGPIDAEISVPELVVKKNLCPHQDFVFFNSLSDKENSEIDIFRENVKKFLSNLESNLDFINILKNHPCVLDPQKNIEVILKNPAYFSSIVIFLNKIGVKIAKSVFNILGNSRWSIPKFSMDWAEILLENFLYKDSFYNENKKNFLNRLKQEAKKIGIIERKNIFLRDNSVTKKLFKESVNKLNSVVEIVKIEHQNLNSNLRMVILTDFIRSEFFLGDNNNTKNLSKIGVVPIFEKIRQNFFQTKKMGILTGSIVIIPSSAKNTLNKIIKNLNIPESHLNVEKLPYDDDFIKIKIKGCHNTKIVHLVTEIFSLGEIEILIGTKSLLGEGWDAPFINTLVLASFVGSFMLSNQMRGRVIRVDKSKPDKIANIWHLASIEKNKLHAGYDFERLKRRFKSFVGISNVDDVIESGFKRLNIDLSSSSEESINFINNKNIHLAQNRNITRKKWETILKKGKIKKVIPEIKTKKNGLPRDFVFHNTIFALFWRSVITGVFFFVQYAESVLETSGYYRNNIDMENILWILSILLGISLFISLPGVFKSLWLFLRNGPIAGNMKQVGNVVLKTLYKMNAIKTDINKIKIISEKNKNGEVFCGLNGGTSYEKSLFLDCLGDIINPIENPRYILIRKNKLNFLLRKDFHTVPKIIGSQKEFAEFFAKMWNKYIGPNELIYTRNIKGRKLLLQARQQAMSASFQKKSERISRWK